ncbi:RWD domain-containing protein 2B-like [Tubulanus polymorphus]|uniref:RWD domain-containing protein 2B-like n=1 Tax=Tubulanus polymorphus TaxID=672921 RepID=UPI003DA437C8
MESEDTEDGKIDDCTAKEMLKIQLQELEMLESMFPDEFTMEDPAAKIYVNNFVIGNIPYDSIKDVRLALTMKIEECGEIKGIELVCQFPHDYPAVKPELFVRSPFSRSAHMNFNDDVHEHLLGFESGEICVYPLVEWIRENCEKYNADATVSRQTRSDNQGEEDSTFIRIWIYSHHIYSKFKRKDILDWAKELKLTGFSMPGKPGVICIEGYSRNVDEFWHRIRRLNWKRLVMRDRQEVELDDRLCINDVQKFTKFEEMVFDARAGKGREYHMDLGLFYKFLKEHDCSEIFSLYFGVDGTSAE